MSRDIEMDTTMDLGVDIGCMDLDMEWTWNGHGRGMDMEWTWSGISKMVGWKTFLPQLRTSQPFLLPLKVITLAPS